MKYSWIDYDKSYISFANSCLDDEAVHYTGCDDGWDAILNTGKTILKWF